MFIHDVYRKKRVAAVGKCKMHINKHIDLILNLSFLTKWNKKIQFKLINRRRLYRWKTKVLLDRRLFLNILESVYRYIYKAAKSIFNC